MKPYIFPVVFLPLRLSLLAQSNKTTRSTQPRIIGSWKYQDYMTHTELVFREDGTVLIDGEAFSYRLDTGSLEIHDDYESTVFQYRLSRSELILSGGDLMQAVSFQRQSSGDMASDHIPPPGETSGITGCWENQGETVIITASTIQFNGVSYKCKAGRGVLLISSSSGQKKLACRLSGDQLSLIMDGTSYTYYRSGTRQSH